MVSITGLPGSDWFVKVLDIADYSVTEQLCSQHWCVFAAPLDMSVINNMAAESMRDIGSDEELSDTEDPDLLVS